MGNGSLPRRARYRNANETICRETNRSGLGLEKIFGVDENDFQAWCSSLRHLHEVKRLVI